MVDTCQMDLNDPILKGRMTALKARRTDLVYQRE
jgi:hypothetical protein